MARMAVYSAVISVLTFIAGVGLITWRTGAQRDAMCDLVRAQVRAYAATPPAPGTPAADLAAAWVRFGTKQHCLKGK
jgi:hypothetical protein